eukprot:tig00000241_g20928.t1
MQRCQAQFVGGAAVTISPRAQPPSVQSLRSDFSGRAQLRPRRGALRTGGGVIRFSVQRSAARRFSVRASVGGEENTPAAETRAAPEAEAAAEVAAKKETAVAEPAASSGAGASGAATVQERLQRALDGAVANVEDALDPAKVAEAGKETAVTVGKNLLSSNPLDYVVLGAQLSAIAGVVFGPTLIPQADPVVLALMGPGMLYAGLGLIALGLLSLGPKNLTPFIRPAENNELVESWGFRLVRHPIYGGLVMASVGWSVEQASPTSLFFALALFAFLDWKSGREEKMLEQFHGAAYKNYRRKVPRKFIPFFY